MSALLLHGLVDADAKRPEPAPRHLRLHAGPLVALATPTTLDPLSEKNAMAAALAHHAVLAAYAEEGDVLPVRYGSAFSGIEAVTDHVVRNAAQYCEDLARLTGYVEYALRIETVGASPSVPEEIVRLEESGDEGAVGRAFLGRRRALRDARARRGFDRRTWIEDLVRGLAPAPAQIVASQPKADRLADLALLLSRGQGSALSAHLAIRGREARSLGLRLALSGPWPAYSFCDEDRLGDRGEHHREAASV